MEIGMSVNCKSIYKFCLWGKIGKYSDNWVFILLGKYSDNWVFILIARQSVWGWNDRIFCALFKNFGFIVHSTSLYCLLDSKSTSKFLFPCIWQAVIQIWNSQQKPQICWALLFNAWFLHVPILFITAAGVVLYENVLICLPYKSNLNDFKVENMVSNFLFIYIIFSVSDHAPHAGFVSNTPSHAKSDASQKSSVSVIGRWI